MVSPTLHTASLTAPMAPLIPFRAAIGSVADDLALTPTVSVAAGSLDALGL